MQKTTLKQYLFTRKPLFLAFIISTLILSVAAPLKSYALQWLIDSKSQKEALMYLLLSAAVVGVSHVSEYVSRKTYNSIATSSVAKIREQIVEVFSRKTMSAYLSESTGDTLSLLTNDLRIILDDYYMGIFNIIFWGGMMLVATVMIVFISPFLLLISLVLGIIPLMIPRIMQKAIGTARVSYSKAMASYTGKTGDLLKGYETLLTAKAIPYLLRVHKTESDNVYANEYEMRNKMNLAQVLTSLAAWLPNIGVLVVGVFLVFRGQITIGYLVTAQSLSSFILGPIRMVSSAWTSLKSCKEIQKKIEDILNKEKETDAGEVLAPVSEIGTENLCFRYTEEAEDVLKGITFAAHQGEKLAIVGSSGSGKSTLIKLLFRYYDQYQGRIMVNGEDVGRFSKASFYDQVSMIPQKPYIFNDTIYNNLCLFQSFTDAEVEEAVRRSGLKSFLDEQPEGLLTVLEENGNNLSGGQMQRIAIARVLLRHRSVILVDEATSNLDVETTEAIVESLLAAEATVIMITHDIFGSYMRSFDRICYMDGGVIAEMGTYDQLMASDGAFKKLYEHMLDQHMLDQHER